MNTSFKPRVEILEDRLLLDGTAIVSSDLHVEISLAAEAVVVTPSPVDANELKRHGPFFNFESKRLSTLDGVNRLGSTLLVLQGDDSTSSQGWGKWEISLAKPLIGASEPHASLALPRVGWEVLIKYDEE